MNDKNTRDKEILLPAIFPASWFEAEHGCVPDQSTLTQPVPAAKLPEIRSGKPFSGDQAVADDNPFAPPRNSAIPPQSAVAGSIPAPYPGQIMFPVGVWRLGKKLVMHRRATLPDRCVKTNGPAEVWLSKKLSWHHPLLALTILLGLLVYIILVIVLQKSARIGVGVSRTWHVRNLWRSAIAWTLTLLATGGCILGGVLLVHSTDWGGWLFLAAFVTLLFGAIGAIIATRIVWPAKITDHYVVLKGVHPEYLAELPHWPHPTGYVP